MENHFPNFFNIWEETLKENTSQDFLVGSSITIADFQSLAYYASFVNHGPDKAEVTEILEKYPTLKSYWNTRYEAQKDYFDNRPSDCSL